MFQFLIVIFLTIQRFSLGLEHFQNVSAREGRNFGRNQPMNEDCTTETGLRGICMRRAECTRNSGTASGFCGTYGVCCELNLACNSISKLKRVTIRNPVPLPTKCTYHFQPYSQSVCQLRIDFDMVLAQPTIPKQGSNLQAVTCELDYFQAADLRLCGTNTNQHIYIPFDTLTGSLDISISFNLAKRQQNPSLGAYWNMVVTQLECPLTTARDSSGNALGASLRNFKHILKQPNNDYNLLAPPGCLQYFTEREGVVETFNFNNGAGYYLANLRYGICFKRTSVDTGVQLSASSFQMAAADSANYYVDMDCHDLLETSGRSNDFIVVPESVLAIDPPIYGTRYCGTSLQNADLFHAPPAPFAIFFNSDNAFSAIVTERGFRISYSIQ